MPPSSPCGTRDSTKSWKRRRLSDRWPRGTAPKAAWAKARAKSGRGTGPGDSGAARDPRLRRLSPMPQDSSPQASNELPNGSNVSRNVPRAPPTRRSTRLHDIHEIAPGPQDGLTSGSRRAQERPRRRNWTLKLDTRFVDNDPRSSLKEVPRWPGGNHRPETLPDDGLKLAPSSGVQ